MTRTSSGGRILVFAKAPQPGRVKTRLIQTLGAQGAARLHARLIERTLATAQEARLGPVELHATPADDEFLRHCAVRYDASLIEQSPGDLGTRMLNAFRRALETASCAILIGTDCPAITPGHLGEAFHALDAGDDAVLGPVEDGGYALIGLTRLDASLFDTIAWSTVSVMDETRARLRALGWRWSELATLWDVDRPADYERVIAGGMLE